MAGGEIILQRQLCPAGITDDDILIFKPAYLIQFRVADIIRRAEPKRQVDFPASSSVSAGLCGK
jgi:hypothetical protein